MENELRVFDDRPRASHLAGASGSQCVRRITGDARLWRKARTGVFLIIMTQAGHVSGNGDTRLITLCGEEIPHPGHVCAFFDSRAEKYSTLAPFFIDAIQAGDRIINVVDANTRDEHLRQLARALVPVDRALQDEQLRVLTSEETYLREGIQDLDGMLELLREALEASARDNCCIRTCGDMSWIGRSRMPVERVLEYEAKVNYFVPTHTCTLLCAYDLATTPATLVSDIMATHPFAIVKGRLRRNPYFVPADEYLGMLRTRRRA